MVPTCRRSLIPFVFILFYQMTLISSGAATRSSVGLESRSCTNKLAPARAAVRELAHDPFPREILFLECPCHLHPNTTRNRYRARRSILPHFIRPFSLATLIRGRARSDENLTGFSCVDVTQALTSRGDDGRVSEREREGARGSSGSSGTATRTSIQNGGKREQIVGRQKAGKKEDSE